MWNKWNLSRLPGRDLPRPSTPWSRLPLVLHLLQHPDNHLVFTPNSPLHYRFVPKVGYTPQQQPHYVLQLVPGSPPQNVTQHQPPHRDALAAFKQQLQHVHARGVPLSILVRQIQRRFAPLIRIRGTRAAVDEERGNLDVPAGRDVVQRRMA